MRDKSAELRKTSVASMSGEGGRFVIRSRGVDKAVRVQDEPARAPTAMRQSVRDSLSPRNACVPRTSSPRTTLERTICRLWQEVLGLDAIGVHDPFLLVGGDSLPAAQIASRLSAVLDAEVLLWELLEASTVAGLASLITQKQLEADAACRNEG